MRRTLLGGVLVLAAACLQSPSAGRGGETAGPHRIRATRGVTVVQLEVVPSGPTVETYGAQVEHDPTPIERAIARKLQDLPGEPSAALSRMARELAASSPSQTNIPPALVDGLMAWSGLVDPPPRLIVVEIPNDRNDCDHGVSRACDEPIASLVEEVEESLPKDAEIRHGVGVAGLEGGATRMVVAVSERGVDLDPLPLAVEHGASIPLRGRLLGERSRPAVELVDPDGRWSTVPALIGDDGSFSARLACSRSRGAYQVEVLAEGKHGPEVVANFPVYCGVDPPSSIHLAMEVLDRRVTAEQIAKANFAYLNDARRMRGLRALEWDAQAARIALSHSHDMAKNGFVGHRSPTTGDVADRFEAAKVEGAVIRENVARGYGPKGIHDSLMNSPGHRINVLAEDVTHVGIGIVVAPPETDAPDAPRPLFATQAFYARPGAGGPPDRQLAPKLREKVDAARSAGGLPAIAWDDRLSRLAAREARAQAKGGKRVSEKEIFGLGYQAVQQHQVQSPSYDALTRIDLWMQKDVGHVGVGVIRIRGDDGDGAFFMVVMVGER